MRNRIVTAVKQRFSIRKLSIGAASVLLGTSLYFMGPSAPVVHAATTGESVVSSKSTDINDPVDVAKNPTKNDTDVNNAIDKYAQGKQEEVGDNALIRASGKKPTTPANTADVRGDQVDSIAKKLDNDVKNANSDQEKTAISNYIIARKREGFSNIRDGKDAKDFADQGLSVDDEKDSEINQISVDHKPITLLKGQSEKIDGIDVTHTNNMTKKEKNDMKINSDNKVIIDLQHDQCQDKEITVTYDNLNNSYYLENIDDKINKIKISKIERTFSDIQDARNIIFKSDGKTPKGADERYDKCDGPQLIIYNDPSDGFFYNNITQVSVKDIYYDDNGNKIFNTENDKNKAWIFVTSLNSNGGGNVEKVSAQIKNSPANAETPANAEKIAGSTVTNINGWWYSDKNNWFGKNLDWDNKNEDNRYGFVGTVAIQYQPGMTLQYRADDSQWGSHWACTQTQVVSTLHQRVIIYDHIKDNVVPKEVTNKWNETIHYVIVDDSSKAPEAPEQNVQSSNWGKTETVDQITGNTVEHGEYDTDWKLQPGEKKYYGEVPNEFINGYHTKETSVAATPVIPDNIEKTVFYYPNGKIIPIDKNGNPILGADQPVFPTDPHDPTKTVNGEIPDVKGYHPEKGKPGDSVAPKKGKPGDDVSVVYVKDDQIAQIIYRDDDDNDKVLATDDSSGKAGSEINYDPQSHIDQFINKGYELKNNGFPAGAVFDNDSNKTQKFYIDFIHGRTTVTPGKPGEPGKPINPKDKDPKGPKWPDGTDQAGLTKTGTQTIQYVGASDKTPAANTQQYTFSKSMVIDKVTGKVLDQGSWNIDSHTFGTVNTPVIPGYQADKAVAGGETVTPDDLNKVVTVSYTKVADQLAQIIYRDDDDNDKVLATDDSSGKAGSEINYDPQSHIDQFINKGYELKNNGFPAGAVFDNDSNKTQKFYIDFIHGRTTVTPGKPGEPGKPINPKDKDPKGPKWPDGTDQAGLTKTGTQTIQYVGASDKTPAANTQQYTFSKSMVIDKVTGKVLDQGSWNIDSHTFGTVNTPVIPGYQADKAVAGGETVTPDDLNKVVTVSYTKVADQLAQIIYRDDDDNDKVLATDDSSGKAGSEINYDPQSHIDQFINKGYELKNNGFPAGAVFDNDSNKTQKFYIDFIHGRTTVTPGKPGEPGKPINPKDKDPKGPKWPDGTDQAGLTKTGTQTIQYVGASDKTPAANTQQYTFSKSMVIDKVTGKVLDQGSWNIDSHTFGTVNTPVIPGYQADKAVAGGETVTPDDLNKVVTVSYTKVADQLAQIIYRDDDDNDKVLATDDSSGKAGSEINYDPQSHIDQFINKGYELKNNGFPAGAVFDNDSNKTQKFYIDFIHGRTTVTPGKPGEPGKPINPKDKDPKGPKWPDGTDQAGLTKTGTQTIQYVGASDKTPAANTQQYTFSKSMVIDKVTGKVLDQGSWNIDSHTFGTVNTPVIPGYQADKAVAGGETVTPDDLNKVVTVSYTKVADQLAQIIYRDDDDNDKVLATDDSSGKAGSEINYDPQSHIDQFINKGYELKNNGFPAGAVFDNDSNKTQKFYIDFIHGRTTVTPGKPGEPGKPINPKDKDPKGPKWPDGTDQAGLTKTGTQTIQYVGASDKTPAANTQQYTFSKSMVIDKVTGKVLDQGSWNIDSHTFGTVNTPVIPGYQADKAVAGGETVTPDDLNKVVTVSYTKVADQLAQIIYRDDDDNDKVLATDDSSGKAGSEINYDPQSHIDQFINKGYELKNNGFPAGAVFDNDSNKTQKFYIDFIHGRTTVTPGKPGEPGKPINPKDKDPKGPKWPDGTDQAGLTKTGTQTIQYVGASDKTPAANTQQYTFSKSMVIDKVTGKVLDQGSWNIDSHTFGTVNTPVIPGYQADKAVAGGETVTPDDLNKVVTVSYTKIGTISVKYHDTTEDKDLKGYGTNAEGKENDPFTYAPASDLKELEGIGYVVDGEVPNIPNKFSDGPQTVVINVKHGTTTVTSNNPGNPGEPVDPKNPEGPKYPKGTELDQVKRTGTQTIHYVGAGDKTPADNKQTFVFTREITFDDVTGKIISVTPWNVQSHTFGNVDTPVIPGYHADKDVAGGATVTPDDLNKVIIVTYAPDGGSGDNPGSNGGGDQGTTPTPEPVPEPTPSPDDQPDTTLPSDNNTDKDVEKDKQDKPKAVKKARKIIKTRITKQEHIGNAEKAEPLAEQEHNDQTVASPVKNDANEPQLPQTGEANTSVIGLLGMLVADFAAILGFESSRSRKHKN